MTAAYRAKFSNVFTTSPTVTLTKPVGTASGDVLVAAFLNNDSARTLDSMPAGWSKVAEVKTATAPNVGFWVCSGVAGGSEPESYDFTFNFGFNGQGAIAAYQSGASVSVVGVAAITAGASSPYTLAASAITVPDDDSLLVFIGGMRVSATGVNPEFTAPVGFNERFEQDGSSYSTSLTFADKVQASAGTSGAVSGSAAQAGAGQVNGPAVLLAIAPAGGSTAITASGEDELPVITAVVLDDAAVMTAAGNTSDQVVTVKDQGGIGLPYLTGTPTSSNEAVATVAQLAATDANGQATVRITTLAAGTATISIAFDGVSDSIALTVVSAGQSARSISPASVTLAPGETQQFVAYADGEQSSHVWSVPVGGGTITPSGLYTAPTGVGTATVRASDPLDSAQYVEATVTIAEAAATGTATVAWPGAANLTLDCFVFDKNDDFVGKFSATFDASGAADLRVPVAYIGERVQVFANNLGSDMSTAGKVHGQKVVTVT